MKRTLVIISLTLATATAVFGWGHEGHQAIADAATSNLTATALMNVMAIINDTTQIPEVTTVAGAATWPDDIKDAQPPFEGKFHATPAAVDFKNRFPDHKQWHFVNYPLEGTAYTLNGVFSTTNDIVHRIDLCLDVLEGNSTALKKKEALAYLLHLVGDLHQPLHVACGYFTINSKGKIALQRSPHSPHPYLSDSGGNGLKWSAGKMNLHMFWDDDLVSANGSKEPTLVSHLLANLATLPLPQNTGAIRDWPILWVDDSIAVADAVYFDPSGAKGTKGKDPYDPAQGTVTATIGINQATYKQNHVTDAKHQLTKGAHDLADLLNAIQWPPPTAVSNP